MSEPLNQDTLWCLRTFQMLDIGGIWGVPRSGLVFQKVGINPPLMALVEHMPHADGMPVAADELLAQQRADLKIIKEKFQEAGITIEGEI